MTPENQARERFTLDEIQQGYAELYRNVECATCARLLAYVKDLLSLLQLPTSGERCGECGHNDGVDAQGHCRHLYESATAGLSGTCLCQCVYPATDAPLSAAAQTCLRYAEMIESQNDINPQVENWSDAHYGQVYAARQLAAMFSATGAVEGEQPKYPIPDWRFYDTQLRATGYTDLANRLRREFNLTTATLPAPVAEGEQDDDCAIGCGCPDDPWNKPSTVTTSDTAREIAVEILEWLNFDTSLDAVQADVYGVWAIISKHIDAGTIRANAIREAVKAVTDFDDWVWCGCGQCKADAHSHAVETDASLQRIAAALQSLLDKPVTESGVEVETKQP